MAGLGGCVGAISRFLVYEMVVKYHLFSDMGFPAATLLVNIFGSFLIGCLAGISQVQDIFSPHIRLLLFVGFLGGFTTFSTFSYELFTMLRSNTVITVFLYTSIHIIFGIFAVAAGFYLFARITPIFFH